MKHGMVSRIDDGPFRYQAWPTVAKAKDGTLFVGCSGHRTGHFCPFGKNYLYESRDEGETWCGPRIINDSYLDDRDVGLLAWGESNLLMCSCNHSPEQYLQWDAKAATRPHYKIRTPLALGMRTFWEDVPKEKLQRRSIVRVSHDNGRTWSEKRDAPVFAPHGPTTLADGGILYIGRKYDLDRTNLDILAYVSYDEGKSWEFRSRIPCPESLREELLSEPYAIRLQNGEIFLAVRSESTPSIETLKIFTTRSCDDGRSWSEPQILDLQGAPAHMLQHSSGAILLTYGRRVAPMGEYARVSRDGGRTWSKDVRISPEPVDWDHGYPTSVELENGDILTVYYGKCPGDDYNSIQSVRYSLDELAKAEKESIFEKNRIIP